MRLTVDTIHAAEIFINALNDREISLRGRKIPLIENLGATKDQCDVVDLSDNEVQVLENIPLLKRLKSLLANSNLITRIDSQIAACVPNLEVLILTNNRISELEEIACLQGLKRLRSLSLLDNPVAVRENYRLFVVSKIPSLEFLDFRKVGQRERDQAAALFGRALTQNTKPRKKLTPSERKEYEHAILKAASQAEIDRLESLMKAGIPLSR